MKMMRYKPMLAHQVGGFERITEEDWQEGLYSQPKLDGVRCLIQYGNGVSPGAIAYSRTGKEWKNINHILQELVPFFDKHPDVILDGELYNHDLKDDFEKIISLVRKTKPTTENRIESAKMVQFHCYDIIDEELPFEQRIDFVHEVLNEYTSYMGSIYKVDTIRVFNEDQAQVDHAKNLDSGYEGSILRTNDVYKCGRSWNLRKFKEFSDSEAMLIDWVEGKGKRKGTIGKFKAVDEDGVVFGMPVMDNFAYLQENFEYMKQWLGKTATFTYFERTKAGSYRHPLFKCIRDYE